MTGIILLLIHLYSVAQLLTWNWYGQPSALLWEDQLFVGINGRVNGPIGALYRGTFNEKRKDILSPTDYWHLVHTNNSHQSKLEIRYDHVLLFTAGCIPYLLPISELPCMQPNDFGKKLSVLRGYKSQDALLNKYSCYEYQRLLFPTHRKPDVAVPPEIIRSNSDDILPKEHVEELRYRAYYRVARFDIQIADPNTVRLFHAHESKLFVSIEPNYLFHASNDKDGKPLKTPPPNRELRTGKLPPDFTDYFAAYRSGDSDYLVTQRGKVYVAVPKGKTEVEVTALWNDPKRIIVGVVQDTKTGAVYGYGPEGEDGSVNRFYVRFEPKPVAKPYRLTVPLWNDRMDAYLESYECARAFRLAEEKK
jgi:hypothetical protein